MLLVITSILGILLGINAQKEWFKTLDVLLKTTADILYDTNAIVNDMEGIRVRNRATPEYECGYLNKVLEEFFRKQVNIYNTSKYMNTRLYTEELVLYLEEIEFHYWEIEHVSHMLHEVERKYKTDEQVNEYDITRDHTYTPPTFVTMPARVSSRTKWRFWKYVQAKMSSTPRMRTARWPKDYGWEIEYDW